VIEFAESSVQLQIEPLLTMMLGDVTRFCVAREICHVS